MPSTPTRLRRRLLPALVLAVGVVVAYRLWAPAARRGELLPSIGGDTWPPVPAKDAGAARA